ncbi:STN domain-containing protein [Hyphomicrobium sp. CS1BSMeth3]|uniref:STN domain-containing protein n=1 Tax=Hyphomicrobium sp. CS1BSMeth3 TaxID=1892844 RepID=UPI001160A220|nr:STN domain-containing protein [Hyphomicrobium sp. CS1BSMeth3]
MSALLLHGHDQVRKLPATRSPRRIRLPHIFVLTILILGLLATGRAVTQEGRAAPKRDAIAFQIPRQPLPMALQAYSRASGVDVFYESHVAAGLESTPVEGALSPEAALRALLAGTDLTVTYTRNDAITLSLPVSDILPPTSPLGDTDLELDTLRVTPGERVDGTELREFREIAQADIEAALRKNTRTRAGNYRAQVRLWVDPSRTVRKAELSQSTGDAERDARITTLLQGLQLRRTPPRNAPQPVRVVIVVRSL